MRVLVIRRRFVIPYKNSRHEGSFRMIILVDEEGTKIQATLFNKLIKLWKDSLKLNKSYYTVKGRLDHANPNYSFVHKEVELAFTDSTIIKKTEHEVPIDKFSYGFSSLEHADKLPNGAILGNYPHDLALIFLPHYVIVMNNRHDLFPDLICILVSVNPLIENENSKRRKIVVTNELMEHIIVTLWKDFTRNEVAFLEKLQDDKPILALCDVRVSIYKGIDIVLPIWDLYYSYEQRLDQSNVPKSRRPSSLCEIIKADNKDSTITPTKVMRRAIEVPLDHILDGLLADSQVDTNLYMNSLLIKFISMFNVYSPIWYIGDLLDCMYKFKAAIEDILNKDDP
ncbi:hypothetical protein H5410_056747, partial [Solanum commersonii]